jgi:GT2 family glycosyltransferase
VSIRNAGAVVIGRNEGARLEVCLQSVLRDLPLVVYVDSGSTDGSLDLARNLGAEVVELDLSAPFTAARGRNAGFDRLLQLKSGLEFVQFIDGDCELQPGWVDTGVHFLRHNPETGVACGRRRERFPEATPYNWLCDIEWDTPIGPAATCGGDSLVRVNAFKSVNGFDASLIAGEEPDLCFRLRRNGWNVERLDAEMTLHDAAMKHFGQWWQRNVRSGYATAEAYHRRGRYEPDLRRKMVSNTLWALPPSWLLWPLLWLRVFRRKGSLYASHIVAGKLPHLIGQAKFWLNKRRGRAGELIEYK